MDNVKMPFIPEETLRTQRVEIYLNDLKQRLKDLRVQHDEVIQNSVDIIQEIDQVSSSLLLPPNSAAKGNESVSNIKRLIQGFETVKQPSSARAPVPIESKVNIQKILQNFEKLNESHVLKDSLLLFKRAKESFEQIDNFLLKMNTTPSAERICKPIPETNDLINEATNKLKNKVNLFNPPGNDSNKESPSHYASCCSSVMSIETFHSTEELEALAPTPKTFRTSFENGYEGDNDDSEYDLFAIKKKKSKFIP